MSRKLICVAGFTALTAFAGTANAQSIVSVQGTLSGCSPVTGLGPNGRPCVALTPIDPRRIADAPTNIEGADRFGRLDVDSLGQTFECRDATSTDDLGTGDGILLYEDCGTPLTPLEYGNLKPFYGTTGKPVASLAPPPVPASATTFVQPPLPAVATPPVGSALPPVNQIAGTSLAGAPTGFVPLLGLAAPFLATAAAGGAIAAAAAAGGGSSTPSTN